MLWLVAYAWARAGGGHSFGGGGGGGFSGGGGGFSGGGFSSGGGGSFRGGGNGDGLLYFLLLEHPFIGLLVIIGFVVYVKMNSERQVQGGRVHRTAPRTPPTMSFALLRKSDPGFSRTLFMDLARLVFTRAHEERGRNNWDALRPFVSPAAIKELEAVGGDVRDVIIGSAQIEGQEVARNLTRLTVAFTANVTEGGTHRYVEEQWRFVRAAGATSLGPDKMRTLACPNCASPIETRTDGSCRNCDTVITDARLQWQVEGVRRRAAKVVERIEVNLGGSGMEVGTDLPTAIDANLAAEQRKLTARHPDFHWVAFREKVSAIFLKIQDAWTTGRWELARPYETDFLFQQHRYWIERYKREGLTNHLTDIRVSDVVPARIDLDPYCEAVTVRIFASMKDSTVDRNGKLVGGDPRNPRSFSEYWTFVRSVNAHRGAGEEGCPSCGAPLDRVSEAGVCGYCDAKVTGGDFDWVLTSIDQDEVYRG